MGAVGLTLILGAYIALSEFRHSANPLDQMTPTIGMVWDAFKVSVTPDEFTGEVALTADIAASLSLLLYGFSLAVSVSLFLGLHAGALPWVNALLDPVLKLFAYIPTIALLFLIFVLFGYGQGAKIFLIFFATVVPLTRALTLHVQGISEKQIWKAETLGATNFEIIWVTLRRLTEPKFLDDLRLQLGSAWIYLIIAELINAPAGLGYRINVASRNMNVATILVYVIVISLLAFLMDRAIWLLNQRRNRWISA